MFWIIFLLLSACSPILAFPHPTIPRGVEGLPLKLPHTLGITRQTTTHISRRNLIDDVKSDVSHIISRIGDKLPRFVAEGIPNFFAVLADYPELITPGNFDGLPNRVLNLPAYANWTENGWNVRFHGSVFKQPSIPQPQLNDLANKFIFGTSVEELPPSQSAQAVGLTSEIFVLQQYNQNVSLHLEPAPPSQDASFGPPGESGGGNTTTHQDIDFPFPTTIQGDYDAFVPINSSGLTPGNETRRIQQLNMRPDGDNTGDATAYLVPTTGLTVVSDVDDILRVTKVYQPLIALFNTFARPFRPWMNMPDIYANWSRSLPDTHFHYLTTTLEQISEIYINFVNSAYPPGSFDPRSWNFTNTDETLAIRRYFLVKLFETFPEREFILTADTANFDAVKIYPEMVTLFPGQVRCIFIRNISATDSKNRLPYNTHWYKDLNQSNYMFFRVPDDLANLDIESGHCHNASVPQNLTFGWQGLPFGIDLEGNEHKARKYLKKLAKKLWKKIKRLSIGQELIRMLSNFKEFQRFLDRITDRINAHWGEGRGKEDSGDSSSSSSSSSSSKLSS